MCAAKLGLSIMLIELTHLGTASEVSEDARQVLDAQVAVPSGVSDQTLCMGAFATFGELDAHGLENQASENAELTLQTLDNNLLGESMDFSSEFGEFPMIQALTE